VQPSTRLQTLHGLHQSQVPLPRLPLRERLRRAAQGRVLPLQVRVRGHLRRHGLLQRRIASQGPTLPGDARRGTFLRPSVPGELELLFRDPWEIGKKNQRVACLFLRL
jgi:hypothetical protein